MNTTNTTISQIENIVTPNYILTKHAIDRFLERRPKKNQIIDNPEELIQKLLKNAFEVRFNTVHQVIRLLNNDVAPVKYLYNGGWIFVCGHNNIIITIERQEDKKFGRDLFRVEENNQCVELN